MTARVGRGEWIPSLLLVGVLAVLLVPLPPLLLDMLLALSLGLTILVLLITLNATRPLDFSVFPGLLLLMTLGRLSLNVATTRLILVDGDAGFIIETFGRFVIAGSLIVGLVIFLILIIIQFVVITKGASRVSEVSARFILDALPGKQMAIDAELNAGIIDDKEARQRREYLMRETEFYGAMDGASKFVRGDAVAGVIITAVNLVGGIAIGLTRGMSLSQAVHTYSVLSVGDGLISQIPALIVATAAGILVTKATSQASLGQEIRAQFTTQPGPLLVGGWIVLALALIPGLPKLPFVALGSALWLGARRLAAPPKAAPAAAGGGDRAAAAPRPEMAPEEFLQVDRAAVELGARLIPLVNPPRGAGLLDRIAALRRDLGRTGGVWVPPIRVRDNIDLPPEGYRLLVAGQEVGRAELRTDRLLAIDPAGKAALPVPGEAATDPAFGLPARWIAEGDRQRAEMTGHTVVDATTVLITHLGEVVRRHAHELLSREDVKSLIDKVRESSPSLVDELVPNVLTTGAVHRVLRLLLAEGVPISHLTQILESLAHNATATKDPVELTDRCRVDLGRVLCERFRAPGGKLQAVVVDPRLEMEFRRALKDGQLALDAARLDKLLTQAVNEWRKATLKGQEVAVLTDASVRRALRNTLARSVPDLAVIAYQEIPTDLQLEAVAILRPE